MRIISQDSMIDIPYEHYGMYINEADTNIYAQSVANSRDTFPIASYKTWEQAKKAMDRLRDAYIIASVGNGPVVFAFPQENEI